MPIRLSDLQNQQGNETNKTPVRLSDIGGAGKASTPVQKWYNFFDFWKDVLGWFAESAVWVSKLAQNLAKETVVRGWWLLWFDEQKLRQNAERTEQTLNPSALAETIQPVENRGAAFDVAKFVWDTAQVLTPSWLWKKILWKAPAAVDKISKWTDLFSKIAKWWAIWVKDTIKSNIISEWELPSVWEVWLWSAINVWLWWAWQLLSKWKNVLYDTAFAWVKKSLQDKWIEAGAWTAWKAIRESWLTSTSLKGLKEEVGTRLSNTRKAIESEAAKWWALEGGILKQWLRKDMIEKLWLNKLNQRAISTQKQFQQVDDIINDYIPEWKISWEEMIQTIKDINTTLPNALLWKGLLDPRNNKKFAQTLEKWVKEQLDQAIKTKAGSSTLKDLYKQYSKDKLIQAIVKDRELQKIFARQLYLWWLWATAWFWQMSQWDISWWLKTSIGGFLAWTLAWKASGNTDIQLRLAKVLAWLAKWEGKAAVRRSTAIGATKLLPSDK